MKNSKRIIYLLAIACTVTLAACTEQKTTEEEKVEINTMDSTSNKAKDVSDKLEAQTKEVEASIEKMDKEFSSDN